MTSRFPPFACVELVSPYNKENITRWLEDTNFVFLSLEHKIHIFSPPCNILYKFSTSIYQLDNDLEIWPRACNMIVSEGF